MVQCQLVGRTLVAAIEGEFDLNITDDVRAVLDGAMDSHPEVRIMVLDLSGVSFIDSSGAGVIFGRHKRLAAKGGRLVLAGAQPQVARALQLLGATQIIQMAGSVEMALKAVGEASSWKAR